jgi:hypothetical protein
MSAGALACMRHRTRRVHQSAGHQETTRSLAPAGTSPLYSSKRPTDSANRAAKGRAHPWKRRRRCSGCVATEGGHGPAPRWPVPGGIDSLYRLSVGQLRLSTKMRTVVALPIFEDTPLTLPSQVED